MRRVAPRIAVPVLSAAERDFARSLVFYEDPALLALAKPAGLAVQAGRGLDQDLDALLNAFAARKAGRPRLVHRLDRETSGLLLAARTQKAAAFLSAAFADRRVEKTYLALVSRPIAAEGVIAAPLKRGLSGRDEISIVAAEGETEAQAARTEWRVLARAGSAALLAVRPETGRMHQIRAHLGHLGAPILGDLKYGGALSLDGRPAARLHLHAWRLVAPHPAGGFWRGQAPPGPDLTALWCELGLPPAAWDGSM